MISFESFRAEDGSPIYQQIIAFLKRGAAAGMVRDGEELPSRRVLSAMLGVNPNTVQKAYHLLEEEGLMVSRVGAGSVMVLPPERIEAIRGQLLETEARAIVRRMRQLGLDRERARELVDLYWNEVE